MNLPNAQRLYEVINATWPTMAVEKYEGWNIRNGAGGGKRVSAATLAQSALADIGLAEAAMCRLDQQKLFIVRDGEQVLDMSLEARGYHFIDPVTLYVCENELLVPDKIPIAQSYAIWEPVHAMLEIWTAGGINENQVSLMYRVNGRKTGLLARAADTPAGTAFVAIDGDIAMIHSVEVLKCYRRQGVGKKLMERAAKWAKSHGAKYMSLVTPKQNKAANTLYQSMGMQAAGTYHYRIKDTP